MSTVVVNSTENTVTVVNSEKRIVVSDSVARGPTGATGTQGTVGAQGVTGDTGIQGAVGIQGPTGNRGLFWERTWTQHLNYSPSQAVFYEGNTYICIESNANTIPFGNTTIWDLLAQKGDIGPQGVQGTAGVGTQGTTGVQGADGSQGATGAGTQGATGTQGADGAIGSTGAQGATGIQGTDGLTGPTGPQGATGDAGPQGATGASGVGLPLANGTSNIDIPIADGYVTVTANAFTWTFNETNGLLELAGNLANFSACSAINFVANSSGDGEGYSTIELRPDSNATNDQYLIIDPTAPNHIHIRAGGQQDNSNGTLILGGENSCFAVASGENPSVSISANTFTWTFDPTDGFISFPDGSTQNTAFNANPVLDYTRTDNLRINSGVEEKYATIANANGTVVHDCANGHIFYHTTPTANWTANFTNLILTNGYATTLTLVINQGATPYYANSVLIDSSVTTINWQGNTAPTPTANRKDVVSFSILKTGENSGNVIILGQLTGF